MPTNSEHETKIRQIDREGLLGLWNAINDRVTDGWEPGIAFEYLVIRAFELDGTEVKWPYRVTIFESVVEQIDGVIHLPGRSFLVEAKDFGLENVSIEPIAKMRNQLLRRPAGTAGIVFSRTGFSESARTLAQFTAPQSILLWNGFELDYALRHGRISDLLTMKYRYCVEHGIPDFDIRQGESL